MQDLGLDSQALEFRVPISRDRAVGFADLFGGLGCRA